MYPTASNTSHQILHVLSDCEPFYSVSCPYVLYFEQNRSCPYFDDSKTYISSLDLSPGLQIHIYDYHISIFSGLFENNFKLIMYSDGTCYLFPQNLVFFQHSLHLRDETHQLFSHINQKLGVILDIFFLVITLMWPNPTTKS